MQGWIKLHRQLKTKPIWLNSTPEHKTILITLLMMANHDQREWEWMGEKFSVAPGQFVTSLESIKEESGKGITIQNVRSALEKFQKANFLTYQSTKTGRLVSIVNWEFYQGANSEPNKDTNKEVTKNQQRGNKEVTTNKNERMKECKNERNINISKSKTFFDSIVINYTPNVDLQKTIYEFIANRKSIKKPLTERALKLNLAQLDKLTNNDDTKIKIINQSIMNGWQGLFPLKEQKEKQSSGNIFLEILEEEECKKRM